MDGARHMQQYREQALQQAQFDRDAIKHVNADKLKD